MSGIDKARETADRIKAEVDAEKAKTEEVKKEVMTQIATLEQNKELARMYAEAATIGSDNLASELPLLKVHATGRSTHNELSDGTEPTDGWFFYKPTGEQFKTITCHILTISKGYRSPGLEGKEVFNQILGGVIMDGMEMKPFIMYFTGLKLSYLWEFGKAAHKYTHAKPVPIPMFALTVRLSTEKVTNNYGKSWVVKFSIVKSEDESPALVMDMNIFQILKQNVETIEDTIASLIAAKASKEAEENTITGEVKAENIPF